MLPTLSQDRKPLLRSNSERERPGMRNWPLFGFLFALVFFFYIIYVYQAQSSELESLREAFEKQVQLAKETKNDLIDAKADTEKFRMQVTSLTTERDDLKTKHSDCTASLRTCSLKTEQFQSEKVITDDQIKTKDSEIETLQKNAAEAASLRSLLTAQETITEQFNKTNHLLLDEIAVLKTNQAAAAAPLNLQANSVSTAPLAVTELKLDTKSTSSPLAAPKADDENQGVAPKIQNLPKEGEGDTLDEKKSDDQVDAPQPPIKRDDGQEQEDKEPEEVKIKAGEYDDKPDA